MFLGVAFIKSWHAKTKMVEGLKIWVGNHQSVIEGHLIKQVLLLNLSKYWRGPLLPPARSLCPPLIPPVLRKNHRLNDTWPVLPHSPPNVTVIMYFVFLSCHYISMFMKHVFLTSVHVASICTIILS